MCIGLPSLRRASIGAPAQPSCFASQRSPCKRPPWFVALAARTIGCPDTLQSGPGQRDAIDARSATITRDGSQQPGPLGGV